MATPLQAAAATGGAGGLAAAGAYGITYAVNSGEEETNDNTELTEEQKNILNEPKDGIITHELKATAQLDSTYNTKVLHIVKKSNLSRIVKSSEEKNKAWWDWAFKHKYSRKIADKVDTVFNSVTTGFLASEQAANKTALNLACEEAYKKEKTEFNKPNGHLIDNIGLFCTTGFNAFDLSEPEATLLGDSDSTNYSNKLAGKGDNKNKLVKPKTTTGESTNYNDKWWDWAFKNRFPKGSDKNTKLAPIFQSVTQGYLETDSGGDGSKTSLNHACDDAYKKAKADVIKPNEKVLENVRQFCTKLFNDTLEIPE